MPNELVERKTAIDINQAVKMRMQGISYEVIGLKYGVTAQAVCNQLSKLKHILKDTQLTTHFEENEISLLAHSRAILIPQILDPAKLKRASSRDLAVTYGVLFDKSRLLKGESTSNIDHRTNAVALKKESDELQAIEDQLKELELVKTETAQGIVYTTEDNK